MRFSLAIDHRAWVRGGASEATLALAERADQGGLDTIWISEDPDGWDAFAVLGAISQRTQRIQLGVGVTNPYLRHPNLIAASVATIDRLAPGRAVLGLGRGQPEWYERGLGMEIGSPLRKLEETVLLLRQWWAPEMTATVDGELHVDHWTRVIGPVESPPIFLAAAGPKALDLAGRVADGVYFNMLATPAYLGQAIERVRNAAHAAGRDPGRLAFVANPGIFITDDPEKVLAGRKRFIANVLALPGMEALLENPDIDVAGIMRRVRIHMKTDEILAAGGAFADLANRGALAAAVAEIPDEMVEPGSAVGSLTHVRERIAEFAGLGVTELMVASGAIPEDAGALGALLDQLRG